MIANYREENCVRSAIDNAINNLRRSTFREDPIGGTKYSRAVSIISSAYKRHADILNRALLERLKQCHNLNVWRDDQFKLSHESLRELRTHQRFEKCLTIELEYGESERTISVDILAFDDRTKRLRAYCVKRGNGSYDGVKRRAILDNSLRTNMLLTNYGRKAGLDPIEASAHVIFYYGLLSLPRPIALAGQELDAHFDFPVVNSIEEMNSYFRESLHRLIEEEY